MQNLMQFQNRPCTEYLSSVELRFILAGLLSCTTGLISNSLFL